MKKILLTIAITLSMTVAMAQEIYNYSVTNDEGREVSLSDFRGKVLLIVNTATRCGFTPQYKELQALYDKHHNEGLEILDFPCNQFGQQAPGTIGEIRQYCTTTFNILFPQFDKIDVNGEEAAPLFVYLKSQQGFKGFDINTQAGKHLDAMFRKRDPDYDKNSDIKWNFTKFLVNKDGLVVRRYEPTEPISMIETDIEELLRNE